MISNLSAVSNQTGQTIASSSAMCGRLIFLKREVLSLIDTPEMSFTALDLFVKAKAENLEKIKRYAAYSDDRHSRIDVDRLAFGIDRPTDQQIMIECLLRAGTRKSSDPIRVLEFGGGVTFPRCRDEGAPHLSRVLAKDPRFSIHMLESENSDVLPEVETTLFNLKVHKCEMQKFLDNPPDNYDVIFGRHLYHPQTEEDCQFVIKRMRQLLARGGVMLLNFDVNLNNHFDLFRFIKYTEGHLLSGRAFYAHKVDCAIKRLNYRPEEFDMRWPEYIPAENANLVDTVNAQVDSIVIDLLRSNDEFKELSRDTFEAKVSVLLGLSPHLINQSTKRLLTANEIRIKCPFQIIQLARKRD